MRLLLLAAQFIVFTSMLLGIDGLFRMLLGPTLWPGMQGIAWALVSGGLLTGIGAVLVEIEMRKYARRDALRSGQSRRM